MKLIKKTKTQTIEKFFLEKGGRVELKFEKDSWGKGTMVEVWAPYCTTHVSSVDGRDEAVREALSALVHEARTRLKRANKRLAGLREEFESEEKYREELSEVVEEIERAL